MANEDQFDRVWEIIERVGVCMLTTRFAGGLRARPLEARPDRDDGRIWFVTDLHSGKEREIESEDDVGLVFLDEREKAYLSITARAQVKRCRGRKQDGETQAHERSPGTRHSAPTRLKIRWRRAVAELSWLSAAAASP